MPTLIDSGLVLAVLGALIGVGRLLQRVNELEVKQKQIVHDLKEHLGSQNTHRSHDWEGEVRSNLIEIKQDLKATSSKIEDSIEHLRSRSDEERKWLNEKLTSIQVQMGKMNSK